MVTGQSPREDGGEGQPRLNAAAGRAPPPRAVRGPAAAAAALLLAGVAACGSSGSAPARCAATAPGEASAVLDVEQTQNAATIAVVGKRLGLADHAVSVALATALQESKLRNLNYGDRDSLGLFQQRPSQGWGPPAKILVPRLAAAAFSTRLRSVPGWQTLPVADAAQAVQHSASAAAYAPWETEARLLARTLTGEVTAALSCSGLPASAALRDAALSAAAGDELGPGRLHPTAPGQVWASAGWLVAHAEAFGVSAVTAGGQRWTRRSGQWQSDAAAGSGVHYA